MSRGWGRWPRGRFLPILFCLLAPAFAGEPTWVEVRSPHFSVVTDAGEKRGREVALRFEQMRGAFADLMTNGAKVTLPVPLQIVAFHNTKAMRPYVPLWKGKPIEVAGWFQGGEDRSFILLDLSTENPWHTVFHEYAHQLLNGNVAAHADPWFEEGFAEYFSSIEVDDKEARVGKIPDEEYLILRQGGMMKIAELFRVQQDSKTYNETGDHRTVFYAQSGMLMHYLYDNRLLAKAGTYLTLKMDGKVPVEDAIQQAFGMTAQQFDKVLSDYLSSGRYRYYPIPAPAGIASGSYSAKPLSAADAGALLADLHLHSRDYREKAIAEFEEVLKLQPDHAAALRSLGYAYLMQQDYRNAGVYFRRAVEHDSNDPRVLYYSVLLLERERGPGLGGDWEELSVARKRLEKSVTLDPEFADAQNLLALTYMAQGTPAEAIQAMKKAVALNPRNEFYMLNLAQMYSANRQYDEAGAVLEPLRRSASPLIASQAEQAVSMVQAAKRGAVLVTSPRLRAVPSPGPEEAASGPPVGSQAHPSETANVAGGLKFLKGRLVAVDCSAAPAADLTVVSEGKTWKFHVKDTAHVIVIGEDGFSCGWRNRTVAVNYREGGETTREIVSVEPQ